MGDYQQDDILRELSVEEIEKLIKIYSHDTPKYLKPCGTLKTMVKLLKIQNDPDPDVRNEIQTAMLKFKVYTNRYGNFENGTFVAISDEKDCVVYGCSKNSDELAQCFRETKLVNYSVSPIFPAFEDCHRPELDKIFSARNLKERFNIENTARYLPKEIAANLEINIPDDIYIDRIRLEYIDLINDLWPHKKPLSEIYLKSVAIIFESVAIYSKATDEILAWCFINEQLALCNLQVREEYRRRGYAQLVVKALSKKIAMTYDHDSVAFILKKNFASQAMFAKLGFIEYDTVCWICMSDQ